MEGPGDVSARQVATEADKRNNRLIFKNCAPITDFISKISNTK